LCGTGKTIPSALLAMGYVKKNLGRGWPRAKELIGRKSSDAATRRKIPEKKSERERSKNVGERPDEKENRKHFPKRKSRMEKGRGIQ